MVTADIFEKLKELQDVLVQKYELEAKVEEAPKQLSAQDELLARLKKEYIAKNTNYESVKDKVLALRFDLDQAVKLREDGEKGMENVETHREYEALGKQIAEAKDKEKFLNTLLNESLIFLPKILIPFMYVSSFLIIF